MSENIEKNQENTNTTYSYQERRAFIQNQKKQALEKNPQAIVFEASSYFGKNFHSIFQEIDAIDSTIRRCWGYSINDEDFKEWNDKLQQLQNTLNDVGQLGVKVLTKTSASEINFTPLRRKVVKVKNDIAMENSKAKQEKATKK
ncbi:hypothetical protein O8I42_01680 [Campylobacter lari]|uniref:hypothetical protein n=2 Tax=Campylobacter lari TaxID=201 RepID=UPI00126E7E7E|nr:hypothetical protein [Campylobacter lari]EAI4827801.1 hypothetical protein [Campylobacter lari]EAK0440193.1 hypothetical protein [Campylobacter lari]EAK0793937.1 hypothetical protein [Campylobacter lari]EAK0794613.1 hypothetical protein [Campylobacter lari]